MPPPGSRMLQVHRISSRNLPALAHKMSQGQRDSAWSPEDPPRSCPAPCAEFQNVEHRTPAENCAETRLHSPPAPAPRVLADRSRSRNMSFRLLDSCGL